MAKTPTTTPDPIPCRGSNGEAPTLARHHQTLTLHTSPNLIATLALGPTTSPLDLSPFGATGCTLSLHIQAVLPMQTDANGDATVTLPRVDATSATPTILAQAFVFDAPANEIGVTTTNAVAVTPQH